MRLNGGWHLRLLGNTGIFISESFSGQKLCFYIYCYLSLWMMFPLKKFDGGTCLNIILKQRLKIFSILKWVSLM